MWRSKKLWLTVTVVMTLLLGPWFFFRATCFERRIEVNVLEVAPQSPRESKPSIKIAAWNIAHGRGNTSSNIEEGGVEKRARISKIAALLREIDADIVVLNEVDFCCTWSGGQNQATQLAADAGYRYCVTQANLDFGFVYGRWYFGNAILSRYPLKNSQSINLRPLNQWEDWLVGCKRGVITDVLIDDQRTIAVMGLHLESRGEPIRVEQVEQVTSAAQDSVWPLIICGDLNTTPLAAPHAATDGHGVNAFEKLIENLDCQFEPTSFDEPSTFTFPANNPVKIIDWILISHETLQRESQTVVQTELSDHLPVVSTVTLKNYKQTD